MSLQTALKPFKGWTFILIMAATAITGTTVVYSLSQYSKAGKNSLADEQQKVVPVQKVTALGRLEPETEVIRVGVPATLRDDRVSKLLVKQGDKVEQGKVIAILESHDRLLAALEEAKKKVEVAQSRLLQVKAGAKDGEIDAQVASIGRLQAQLEGDKKTQETIIERLEAQLMGDREAQRATLARLDAELNNAEAEYQRYQQLYQEGGISNSLFDSKRLVVETKRQELSEARAILNRLEETGSKQIKEAQETLKKVEEMGMKQIREARGTLNKISEVRPVDVLAAQADVESAMAAVKRAEEELKLTEVAAPASGQILKIHSLPGETIQDAGILELGETDRMVAVAEIYQTEIGKIKVGQSAVITSEAFSGELKGVVSDIGLQVSRQNVFSNQPGENLDRRVIEVKVLLNSEDSKKVAGLTNLQVQVGINI